MRASPAAGRPPGSFGSLLRAWRSSRRLSQLALAVEADVSARHVSFLESGRARASARMVMRLAAALELPLRDRNLLLLAAGHAPAYRESDLSAPPMAQITHALSLMLRANEPFSAWALDARWRLVMANRPFAEALTVFWATPTEPHAVIAEPRPSLLDLLADHGPATIRNWQTVLRLSLARAHRDALFYRDAEFGLEVRAVATRAGIDADSLHADRAGDWRSDSPVVEIEAAQGDGVLRFFNTLATLGAPQDVTLQELRIEALHPADAETDRCVRELAAAR